MGLESGTWVDDLTASYPAASDPIPQGDDHIRLVKSVLRTTFPRAGKAFPFFTSLTKTGDYSVASTDEHTFFLGDGASATVDFSLPNLGTGDDGWYCYVRAKDITHAVSLTPTSGNINGGASVSFSFAGQSAMVWWTGTEWFASFNQIVDIVDLAALVAPAVGDSLLIYDLSATTNKSIVLGDIFKVINGLDVETSLALDDVFPLYDTSEGAGNGMAVSNILKAINLATEDTAPDLAADFLLSYDTSASAAKKILPNKITAPYLSQMAKAWVSFTVSGSTATIQDSYNIASVVRNSTGNYTITFTDALADAHYCVVGTTRSNVFWYVSDSSAPTTTSFVMLSRGGGGTFSDPAECYVAVFGP